MLPTAAGAPVVVVIGVAAVTVAAVNVAGRIIA